MDQIAELSVDLRRVKKSRHLRLSITADGRVLLTRPFWVSERRALIFLEEKRAWLTAKWRELQARPNTGVRRGGREEYLHYKTEARALVLKKLDQFNNFYHFNYRRLSIRNQRSRWGSCSKNGGLNFNYRVLFLPEPLLDYVIVHELCHLQELNHGPIFWNLVAKVVPDYLDRRRALREF